MLAGAQWRIASLIATAATLAMPAAAQTDAFTGESFASFLARHFEAHREEAPDATYRSAAIDLDGDGRREMLVYLDGQSWCGPHSCDLFIFTPERDGGWRLVQELALAAPPITLLSSRSSGWRDLGVHFSTSLAPGERRILSWSGSGYALSPLRLREGTEGRVLIGRDDAGMPLFAERSTRDR